MESKSASTDHQSISVSLTNLLIDGTFQSSVSGETFVDYSPVTEKPITNIALANEIDVDLAVQAAQQALYSGPWSKMGARERGNCLYKLADLIDKHTEELAILEVMDTGKPIRDALGGDIPDSAETIRYFAGWADKMEGRTIPIAGNHFTFTRKEPVGVCALIVPWNYPLSMACWKIAPCLAAGCTAILKPAEQSPLTALKLGQLALEAGIPPGVLNVLPGFGAKSTGEALVNHPGIDKIAFTGEGSTAIAIKQATAHTSKRLSFELGGKSPNIIFDDADLELALTGAFGAVFSNQGQNCCAGSRTFIHRNIYDTFVSRFADIASQRRIGSPYEKATEHGTQIDDTQFNKIMAYIEQGMAEGAECVSGGKRYGDMGYFIEPTVFANVTDDMRIAQEEIFGPVACLLPFDSLEEVIQRANDTKFGLAGAVWTQNMDIALTVSEQVKAGTMWVNCYNVVDSAAPFGGFKDSGSGRELGKEALSLYTETKTVTIKR